MSEAKASRGYKDWKVAVDPKTSREYYYDNVSKETTWIKPFELYTREEQEEILRKKEETKLFFADMEKNILRKYDKRNNEFSELGQEVEGDDFGFDYDDAKSLQIPGFGRRGSITGTRLVRTMSSMDDDVMEMMKRSDPKPDKASKEKKRESKGAKDDESMLKKMSDRSDVGNIKRRNSTGTLYIDSTMGQQDNDATIRCVCAVIRAHLLDAEREGIVPRPDFNTFKDEGYDDIEQKSTYGGAKEVQRTDTEVPSLKTVYNFFSTAFSKSQMENECIIMTLIYVEKLVKVTKGRFCIRFDNWRSTLFACMILASKVWDDLSMWNVDFSQINSQFDLPRINELELALLDALSYEVKVPAGEYAKYYFHLRSMMARLGVINQENVSLAPLNMEGARKLQLATEAYEESKTTSQGERPRCVSMSRAAVPLALHRAKSTTENTSLGSSYLERRVHVGLEHLIHDSHTSGDGTVIDGSSQLRGGRRRTDINIRAESKTKKK